MQNEARTIYENIQLWLEGREAEGIKTDPRTGYLIIEIAGGEGEKPRQLRFRRQILMGQRQGQAQSLENDATIIPYDPAWESVAKIDKLLKDSAEKAAKAKAAEEAAKA